MHIDITTKNIELTDALRSAVEKELAKTAKIIPESGRVYVEIGKTTNHHKNGEVYKAEASVTASGENYFVDVVESDLYTAIATLGRDLFSVVTQNRGKMRTLLKRGRSIIKQFLRLS